MPDEGFLHCNSTIHYLHCPWNGYYTYTHIYIYYSLVLFYHFSGVVFFGIEEEHVETCMHLYPHKVGHLKIWWLPKHVSA